MFPDNAIPLPSPPGRILIAIAMRAGLSAFLFTLTLAAQGVPAPDGVAYFEQNIRPLLAANCYGCHSSKFDKPMGGLLLDSRAGMLKGGKSGVAARVPGKTEERLLLGDVLGNDKDLQVPPGKVPQP